MPATNSPPLCAVNPADLVRQIHDNLNAVWASYGIDAISDPVDRARITAAHDAAKLLHLAQGAE